MIVTQVLLRPSDHEEAEPDLPVVPFVDEHSLISEPRPSRDSEQQTALFPGASCPSPEVRVQVEDSPPVTAPALLAESTLGPVIIGLLGFPPPLIPTLMASSVDGTSTIRGLLGMPPPLVLAPSMSRSGWRKAMRRWLKVALPVFSLAFVAVGFLLR